MTPEEELKQKQADMSNKELIELATSQVFELAKTGGKSHRMCVPPMITDTDMLFCELIRRFESQQKEQLTDERIKELFSKYSHAGHPFNAPNIMQFVDFKEAVKEMRNQTQGEIQSVEAEGMKHYTVYESELREYDYMSTVWTRKQVNNADQWCVMSEHDTKDLAATEAKRLNNLKE